jgi:hypothetical protein
MNLTAGCSYHLLLLLGLCGKILEYNHKTGSYSFHPNSSELLLSSLHQFEDVYFVLRIVTYIRLLIKVS